MAQRFPDDFHDLMETFKMSEDVLHDISAISRLKIADETTTKKVQLMKKILTVFTQ
jgi:hypothetical protein